jgi:hypothetical protein
MSPPLTPSADEARRLLSDELGKPTYLDARNWLLDQLHKLLDWLSQSPQSGSGGAPLSSGQGLWMGFGIAVVILVVIWALAGPLRAERRRARELFGTDERNSSDLRSAAADLATAGEWGAALIELFRAMIRSLSERVIIEEFAGMTADEASALAAARLPELADRLALAAHHFDAVAYGHQPGTAAQYQLLVALDAAVAAAKPTPIHTLVDTSVSVEVAP